MSTDTTPRPDPGRRHDATAMTATARGKRTPTELDSGDAPELSRGLENRHLQLIAIGGAIGTGLFLGAGGRLASAGPGLFLAYALCGIFVFFILRALGELVLHRPSSGSFVSYAREFYGEKAAYVTGWMYWLNWALTGIAKQDLSGPIAIGADFGGRLDRPSVNGIVRATALHYQNETYGTDLTNIAIDGAFTQSRLQLNKLTAKAGSWSAASISARAGANPCW